MRGWKFLDLAHRHHLMNGQLQFRRLVYYRLLEVATGDAWIGDVNEGVAVTEVRTTFKGDETDDEALREQLAQSSAIRVEKGARNVTIAMDVHDAADCLVMSLSAGDFDAAANAMCRSPLRQNYDACVEIADLESLTNRILNAVSNGGKPLRSKYDIQADQVTYSRSPTRYDGKPFSRGDPFQKDPQFEPQREWRIVLTPRDRSSPPDRLLVNIDAGGLFRPIEIADPLRVSGHQMTPQAAFDRLKRAVEIRKTDPFRRGEPEGIKDLLEAYLVLRGEGSDTLDTYALYNAPRLVFLYHIETFLRSLGQREGNSGASVGNADASDKCGG